MADSVVEVLLTSATVVEVATGTPGTPGADAEGGGGAVDSVNGATGVVVLDKDDIGLGNVDNTADSAKPVSTAQATALAGKASTSHTHAESDVTGLTAALAGKAAASHTHAEGDVTGLTAALAGKSATGHTHTSADLTDFNAAVDARVALGGGSSAPEVRHSSDASYSYMGNAADGTAEGSAGWTVTRITLTSPPVIETGTGTWTGRAGITYS